MFPVSSTSALVLLQTPESVYDSDSAKKFFKSVELDAGVPLLNQLQAFKPGIKQKLTVVDRKFGVQMFCHKFLKDHPDIQVVSVGGGLDPLAIDLAELFPRTSIFEVDNENMELKKEINQSIEGPKNIRFCEADLDCDFTRTLKDAGWNPDGNTLVVAEGITYYLKKDVLKKTLKLLKTPGGAAVLEYSIPDSGIQYPKYRKDVSEYFKKLADILDMPHPLVRYHVSEIEQLAFDLDGEVIETKDMRTIERERTGKNECYVFSKGIVRVSFAQWKT